MNLMLKILDRLELAANTNPAEALKLLPELFRAVHEGMIVELPCKVGDTAYRLCNGTIHNGKITGISVAFDKTIFISYSMPTYYNCERTGAIGITVFLTREAAIKRLESKK